MMTICYCRICHEQDPFYTLEAPCNCSGTLKFAHRKCIQRWCHQKGNTSCEICLQKYKGGYTTIEKQIVEHVQVSIVRGQVHRDRSSNDATQRCSISAANSTDSRCKLVALIVTLVLLLKNLTGTLAAQTLDYPFTLYTLLLLKTALYYFLCISCFAYLHYFGIVCALNFRLWKRLRTIRWIATPQTYDTQFVPNNLVVSHPCF